MQNNKKYMYMLMLFHMIALIDVKFKFLSFPLAAVWTDVSSLLVKGQTPNTIEDSLESYSMLSFSLSHTRTNKLAQPQNTDTANTSNILYCRLCAHICPITHIPTALTTL